MRTSRRNRWRWDMCRKTLPPRMRVSRSRSSANATRRARSGSLCSIRAAHGCAGKLDSGEARMEVFKDVRKKEYLNAEGADKPLKSPIPHATLRKARTYRKQRLVDQLRKHDCGAILLYDPCNIRH